MCHHLSIYFYFNISDCESQKSVGERDSIAGVTHFLGKNHSIFKVSCGICFCVCKVVIQVVSKEWGLEPGLVTHPFNPSPQKAEVGGSP